MGFAFACLFIVIQLVPIGNLGVSFSVPSYIIFGVWIVLGGVFFLWQTLAKRKKGNEEVVETVSTSEEPIVEEQKEE